MQIADFRAGLENRFAIEFEDNTQDAVRGWVLRTHVKGHAAAASVIRIGWFDAGWIRCFELVFRIERRYI